MPKIITEFQQIVGSKNVFTNDKDYSTTTFSYNRKVIAAVLPKSKEEIIQCIQIANTYKTSIYAVSSGKNFGLGSKIPTANNNIILDLKRMNQITSYNEELCHVTVQPGVTFKQLEDFLIGKGGKLMMDSIGSTPHASIVGNTMERGHGMGLYADRFDYTCNLEVILPTGKVIRTGMGDYASNKVSKLTKWGIGANIAGLFTQSNFGIVTELTLWLKPRPEHFQSFMIHIEDDSTFHKVIDRFRDMKLRGLQASFRIFNDYRMFAFQNQYHQVKSQHDTHLTRERLAELKPKNMGKWIAIGGLYSYSKLHANAEKQYIISYLKNLNLSITFWDQAIADKKVEENPNEQEELNFFFYKSTLAGYTSRMALNMCYWRVPHPIPENKNIHEDGCGLLWYCPSIPCTGNDAIIANNIIEEVSFKHQLEPNIGFLFISDRTLDITGAICFNKNDPQEMKNAKKCHDEIMDKLIKAGYPPYRLGIQSMKLFKLFGDGTKSFLDIIKKSIDPNNILSRKRYSRL